MRHGGGRLVAVDGDAHDLGAGARAAPRPARPCRRCRRCRCWSSTARRSGAPPPTFTPPTLTATDVRAVRTRRLDMACHPWAIECQNSMASTRAIAVPRHAATAAPPLSPDSVGSLMPQASCGTPTNHGQWRERQLTSPGNARRVPVISITDRRGREAGAAGGGGERCADARRRGPRPPRRSARRSGTRPAHREPWLRTQATKALRLSIRCTRPFSTQEIERAVDRDRRRARRRPAREPVDDLVGAERACGWRARTSSTCRRIGVSRCRARRRAPRHAPWRPRCSGRGRGRAPERRLPSWLV